MCSWIKYHTKHKKTVSTVVIPCIYLYNLHWSDVPVIACLSKISVVCPLSTQYDLFDGFIEGTETLSKRHTLFIVSDSILISLHHNNFVKLWTLLLFHKLNKLYYEVLGERLTQSTAAVPWSCTLVPCALLLINYFCIPLYSLTCPTANVQRLCVWTKWFSCQLLRLNAGLGDINKMR